MRSSPEVFDLSAMTGSGPCVRRRRSDRIAWPGLCDCTAWTVPARVLLPGGSALAIDQPVGALWDDWDDWDGEPPLCFC